MKHISRLHLSRLSLLGSFLIFLLAACIPNLPVSPVISTATTTPTQMTQPQDVVIGYKVKNTDTVVISAKDSKGEVEIHRQEAKGSRDFVGQAKHNATETTTYTIYARSDEGLVAKKVLVVEMKSSSDTPNITSFSATPNTITAGNAVSLALNVSNAEKVVIKAGNSTLYEKETKTLSAFSDTFRHSPTATTEYTLIASKGSNKVEKKITVTINPVTTTPDFSLRLEPTSLRFSETNTTQNVTLIVTKNNTFNDAITFSSAGTLPSGLSISQPTVSGNQASYTVSYNSTVANGDYTVELIAQAGTTRKVASLTINVQAVVGNDCDGNFRIDNTDTQGDIDKVKNCKRISGSLSIYTDSLTNLNFLNNLTYVGSIQIIYNVALTDIKGLANLREVKGRLQIYNNNLLANLDGLEGLKSVAGITIENNPLLRHIDGLRNLEVASSQLEIKNNPLLENIDGLSKITLYQYSVTISNNQALKNINGFANVTAFKAGLDISLNPLLTDLRGLAKVASIGGSLSISHNKGLTSLAGLENLSFIADWLIIRNNTALTTLDGLNKLTSIRRLSITENSALNNIDALSNVAFIRQEKTISNNASFDCSPYNSKPYKLKFFPLTESKGNKVNCALEPK